jgi:ABC-type amino acid transport substrate-binding protein
MQNRYRHRLAASSAALTLALCSITAHAQSPTLERIADKGVFNIGYRTDASPLYSVDLCRRIAAAVKQHLGRDDIETRFVPVSGDSRIDDVSSGKIDIECGATTLTISRQESVDFTILTFVTGASVLSLAESGITTLSDLSGKVTVADREEGMTKLNGKGIDAFASDQIVLIGQVIEALYPKRYSLVSETFSYEPYAFMVPRNDSEFRLVANRALTQIYRSGQHIQIYNKWIGRIGIQPSPLLLAMFQLNIFPE